MLFRQGSCLQSGHNLLRVAWRAPHARGRTRPALPLRRHETAARWRPFCYTITLRTFTSNNLPCLLCPR